MQHSVVLRGSISLEFHPSVNLSIMHTTYFQTPVKHETQLSLTNRATRLEILTFEKYRHPETG